MGTYESGRIKFLNSLSEKGNSAEFNEYKRVLTVDSTDQITQLARRYLHQEFDIPLGEYNSMWAAYDDLE